MGTTAIAIVSLIVLAFILLVLAIALGIIVKRRSVEPVPVLPTAPPTLDTLPDLSEQPCCVINGETRDQAYYAQLQVVVSTVPTPASVACNGLQGETLQACTASVLPTIQGTVANPVARKGAKPYYALYSSQGPCSSTNPCPVIG
jgi:hypothetical protein